jgi:uncharacterized repeat protein (TIGR01451 family)
VGTLRSFLFSLLACAVAPLALAQEADLAVSKSGPGIANAGTDVTYTVTVTNVGPDDAAAVQLADPIPAGMTFVAETHDAAFLCSTPAIGDPGSVNCLAPTLAANSSANFSFTFHIDPSAAPGTSFTNAATVSSQTFDPNSENDQGVAVTLTPSAPQGDISIIKDGPPNAGSDTDVAYTITVSNTGPDGATKVSWTDTLPGTMTFVSFMQNSGPAMSCSTGQTVTCTTPSFPPFSTATFTLTGHIPASTTSGTFTNTATISAENDPNPDNNSSTTTLVVSAVDLAVVKNSGTTTANPASDISYTITVRNNGPDAATGVVLNDTMPAGTTFGSFAQDSGPAASCGTPAVGEGGAVTCTFITLPANAPAQFTLTINTGSASSPLTNTATVGSENFDTDPANNTSSATTTVTQSADLAVTKTGPTNVTGGSDATYTITVTNNGPSNAAPVSLSDAVPANATFGSMGQTSGPTFNCSTPPANGTGTITCTIATLNAGATATFNLLLHISPVATGSVSNTANVSSPTPDPNTGNNGSTSSALVTPGATDVGILKTANPGVYFAGGNATFTILVTNNGPGLALGTMVTDILPAGSTLVSAIPSQGTCTGTTTVSCSLGTLNPTATATITLTLTLPITTNPVSNTATVTITNGDLVPADNTSTATITPLPSAGIPTLSEWALAALAVALALVAARGLSRP